MFRVIFNPIEIPKLKSHPINTLQKTQKNPKPHFLKTEKPTLNLKANPRVHILKHTTKTAQSIPWSQILITFKHPFNPVFGEGVILLPLSTFGSLMKRDV